MPAACSRLLLLLLLLLLLALAPPAGSLPLASPRRLPPSPPPPAAAAAAPPPARSRPCSPPAAGRAVIESGQQGRGSADPEIRTSRSRVDVAPMSPGSGERTPWPAAGVTAGSQAPRTEPGGLAADARHAAPLGQRRGGGTLRAGAGRFPRHAAVPFVSQAAERPTLPPSQSARPAAGSSRPPATSSERGKTALASPSDSTSTPVLLNRAAERTPPVLGTTSTSADVVDGETLLPTGQSRGVWDIATSEHAAGTLPLHPSSDTDPPASSSARREQPSGPRAGGAGVSPTALRSSGGTLPPLPSSSISSSGAPSSPEQPQSSPSAPSARTGGSSRVPDPRHFIEDSTSPLLMASPGSETTFRATGSSLQPVGDWAAESRTWDFQTGTSSPAARPQASSPGTWGSSVSPGGTLLAGASVDRLPPPLPPAWGSTDPAIGSSYQPSNFAAAEEGMSHFPTTSTYVPTPSTRGGGRTFRSLPSSTSLTDATEISTSSSETIRPLDQTQSSGTSLAAEAGGGTGATAPFMDPLLTDSASTLESASKTFGSTYEAKSISTAEEGTLHSATSTAAVPLAPRTSAAEKTVGSLASSSFPRSTSSADAPGSSGKPLSSAAARTPGVGGLQGAMSATEPATDPVLTRSPSASEGAFTGIRSSYRPTNSSATEKRAADSSTTSAYVSATATGTGGRTLRSVANSSRWAAEDSTSGSGVSRAVGTSRSSPVSSIRETYGVNRLREITDVTEPLADPSLTHSYSSSEMPSTATRSSHVSFSVLSTEKRTDFPTTNTYVSTPSTRGGGRTFRSLPSSTSLTDATEISTSSSETIRPLDQTQSSGTSLAAEAGGGTGATAPFMDPLLTDSEPSSESTFPEKNKSDPPFTSAPSAVTATRGVERTMEPVANISAVATGAAESSTSLDPIHLSSSVTEAGRQHSISQSDDEFSELSTQPLPIFSSSASMSSSSPDTSEREERVSSFPTESPYISTAFSRHGEGTSQAPINHSTWSEVTESSTFNPDIRESRSRPFPSATAWPGGGPVPSSDAGYTEPGVEVTLSSRASTYFSAPREPSTTGSSHHSRSSSSTEKRISSAYTDPMNSSATVTGGGERMLRSVTNDTLTRGTESSTSHAEIAHSSEVIRSVSMEQSRTANTSASSMGVTGFATEALFTHSSKIPTYSSFQNDLSSFPSSHQPVSSVDTEKRTSVSHTDGTYISTTYTRGGERTLLSISNSSTSADSSESSTFFSEISSPSDSSQSSSVTQDRRSNVSSDGSFIEPSTEPLLVHSSKPLTSASTGSVQNTTIFDTDSELLPTGRSSLSASAFPSSSSVSSLHRSLSSTPSPTYLFASSESSKLLSSSAMPSSPPLQALSTAVPTSSLLSSSYSLTSLLPLFSSSSSVSQSNDSGQASTSVATTEVRQEPSTAAIVGSSPRETSKSSGTHQPQNSTVFVSAGSPPLPTEPMEQLSSRAVSVSASVQVTESPSPRVTSPKGGSFGNTTPLHTTAGDTPRPGTTEAPHGALPSTTNQSAVPPVVALTTEKPAVLTTPAVGRPTLAHPSTTKAHRPQTPAATKTVYATGESTEAVAPSTSNTGKVTEENIPVTSPPEAPPSTKTTVSVATTLAAATKPTTVPLLSSTAVLRTSSPVADVDECLSNPCPALATCNNTHGSYICQCPLGYELEKGKCNLVRIFIGQVPLKPNITHGKYAELVQVEGEILAMLDASLAGLPGYHHSVVKATREAHVVHVSVRSTFSLASNVTFYDVVSSVKSYVRACASPPETCQFIASLKALHRVGSLCKQKDPECDKETSECTDFDGVALCQCKSGYFKYNKMDHSCRACEDGYKLENETCVSCPFGLGGFNCGNPYQLITVVIAAAGGGLLLILGIALIITCCRKNKNDISKLIFKSGDFQMSPYAEYPKNPRAQEWGRETIEMQENGSTKNLLQMTDVYYSPTGLRNPELERNGLYPPYTGLPGSRHSCIYPGQYNPSFISDETRRRDYF
ncbi:protein HEG homolog 1 isoform X2 [Struthio camelus]|uniref:protein HEG homolog 1 isoform X2 n=1 Tax=Struthio camelus TaxID=8801 RepID=UPI003603E5B8